MKVFTTFLILVAAVLLASSSVPAQSNTDKKKGAVLNTPDKFMRAPLADFNGLLMLNPDAAAAIVVTYPNKGESMEELIKRLLIKVPEFFNKLKSEETVWTNRSVDVHTGDIPDSAIFYSGTSGDSKLQFITFQRVVNGLPLMYGYFAMRSSNTKESDARKYWLDENGKGVKPFESFTKDLIKNNP